MKKNFLGVISEFSKKLNRFEESENDSKLRVENISEGKKLQNEINLSEEERKKNLINEYKNFAEPVIREIEEDEENLLAAYKLFTQIMEINSTENKETHLVDNRIASPICMKAEYTSGKKFKFLKIWFVMTKKDAVFVPEISCTLSKKYCLEFIKKEDWKPDSAEKELMQIIGEN